jgi:acetolactate synthase-1/2/3 large subunit
MLGMHGTYEANLAMHGCDVMLNIGARFDDRVTGRLNAFAPAPRRSTPTSTRPPSTRTWRGRGDRRRRRRVLAALIECWKAETTRRAGPRGARRVVEPHRRLARKDCLRYRRKAAIIKPQHAVKRLHEITRETGRDTFISTEVGQHQMWAAQYFGFEKPNRWMTSGGLGTMGYGLPAAMGVQIAHPDALVIDIAGEASILMNIQEMGTLAQYRLPVKVFILNNEYMGMVRQWQELLHGGRYSESYSAALPDFVKLADSFHATGLRAKTIDDLDRVIREMLAIDGPVIADIMVAKDENCFPMIPSGAAHNEMILAPGQEGGVAGVTDEGKVLV